MNRPSASCPGWLVDRLLQAKGAVGFNEYMDWVLNDEEHGAYSKGNLGIGRKGDFVTSPSLGPEFAELLVSQLVDWFEQLDRRNTEKHILSLIELGPGDGELAFDLLLALEETAPALLENFELIMVEPNSAMVQRQKLKFEHYSKVPVKWMNFDELCATPIYGIIIAHEVLDALPVERIILRNKILFRQGVKIIERDGNYFTELVELPLPDSLKDSIISATDKLQISIPPTDAVDGWNSEWHSCVKPFLLNAYKSLRSGAMLIIDYALEAKSYYTSSRSSGTILAYHNQRCYTDILYEPGVSDLTSHICLDTLKLFAAECGWNFLGDLRQGQALLALGLAQKLNSLNLLPNNQIDLALSKRENLLRLVDPYCLGDFRWVAFEKIEKSQVNASGNTISSIFLEEPRN